jgi:UDP-N-acetyl-D-glucosamine dehydrogenase
MGPGFGPLLTMIRKMRIAIIGQGYVGLTISSGAVGAGHEVLGIDNNPKIVDSLNLGESHIEGIRSADLKIAIDKKLFRATSDFSELTDSEVVVIAVPTPLDLSGEPDLKLLESACDSIAPYLGEHSLVINESTSFVGTLRTVIAARIRAINPKVTNFAVSPERVDPGNEHFGVTNTPRLVGGIGQKSGKRAVDFYSSFCRNVVEVSSPEVAEAAKLLENSFRFVNIGFINEFAQMMNAMNVPVSEVIQAASTKPYGFMPFFPNVGIGGHCIPVDPLYLQKNAIEHGIPSKYIHLSESLNQSMPDYCLSRLSSLHGDLKGKSILIFGVSYKPNISDTRESPAEQVIQLLKSRGATVKWHDPLVPTFLGEESTAIDGEFDLGLVLSNHDSLDFKTWIGAPIYCVNPIKGRPEWIPLLAPLKG